MTTPLLGLIGRARSGKDTFASTLTADHGFTRYAFADALKAAALGLDPLVRIEQDETGPLGEAGLHLPAGDVVRLSLVVGVVGWETAKEVREVRRTLQSFGVGMREHVDSDVWVRGPLERALAAGSPAVFTDVRFPNEADAIKAAGGTLVRIVRGGGPTIANADHVSETALDGYLTPYVVENSGTLADLALHASLIAGFARR
ncbi:hypothetical protein [Cellulosimicrobium sp. TH-20]|uniref:deoxynucleotide monophosphate kinase family protein n=1 Tax=Cellulosimicrobium sp. TH-20 TaxID=1980001 RepID=UPI0011A1397D|nr:hypothetical protein [Cellulosimicrobium sp. TH-20]